MDQIRLVLLSYPGGIQTLLGNIKEFLKSTTITTNLENSQYNNVTLETLANGSIAGTPSPGLSYRQHSPGSSGVEEDIRNIPEHYLPDIVGRALLHNSNSVIQLQETSYQLRKVTEEDKMKLTHQHWKLGRHFLERPDEVRYEDFVHYLQQEGQKELVKIRVIKGKKEAHCRAMTTKAQRTAKKNPKRAASAQLVQNDLIAEVASDRDVDSTPRATETFPSNMADEDDEME
jgi:hypothetical protein